MCLGWRISEWHGWMPSYCISNLPNDSVQRTFSPARPSTSLPNNRFQLKNIVPLQIEFKIYGMIPDDKPSATWAIWSIMVDHNYATVKPPMWQEHYQICLPALSSFTLSSSAVRARVSCPTWYYMLSSELKWSECNENHWLFIQFIRQIDTNCKFVRKTIGMLAPSHYWRSWTGRSNSSQDPEPSWVPEKIWKECLTSPRLCGSCFNMFLIPVPWTSIFAKMEIERCWTAKASRSPKVM